MTTKSDAAQADLYVAAAKNEGPILTTFLDWLSEQDYVIARHTGREYKSTFDSFERLERVTTPPERLLAEHLNIDLDAVERHRVRVLDEHRKKHSP